MVMVNCCAKMKTGKKPHPVSWTGSTGNWISTLAREASMEKSFWKGETISLVRKAFFEGNALDIWLFRASRVDEHKEKNEKRFLGVFIIIISINLH